MSQCINPDTQAKNLPDRTGCIVRLLRNNFAILQMGKTFRRRCAGCILSPWFCCQNNGNNRVGIHHVVSNSMHDLLGA